MATKFKVLDLGQKAWFGSIWTHLSTLLDYIIHKQSLYNAFERVTVSVILSAIYTLYTIRKIAGRFTDLTGANAVNQIKIAVL